MSEEKLECILEEELPHGCTPIHVLEALHKLSKRCEQHKADEPGLYRDVGPTAKWSSENLRSNWRVTMKLYRTPNDSVHPLSGLKSAPPMKQGDPAQTESIPSAKQTSSKVS